MVVVWPRQHREQQSLRHVAHDLAWQKLDEFVLYKDNAIPL